MVMVYDQTNRLTGEAMAQPGLPTVITGYAYDAGSNRTVKLVNTDGSLTTQTLYTYNHFNQLTGRAEEDGQGASTRSATFTYDGAGNRETQALTVTGQAAQTTIYHWDAENRLEGVTLPNAQEHEYGYDYRMRRISRVENGVGSAIVFSGGLSVAEYEAQGITPTVEYLRGPDTGGGVGGMMYSLRNGGTEAKYALSNGRGDVVGQSDSTGSLTWTASYEAYGKRPVETGTNADRQRANTKEEDPTGLLNEGFRYRDIVTGVWLSRDPAGFVDGPNVYAYVRQNPWTSFDPEGLESKAFLLGGYTSADHGGGAHVFVQIETRSSLLSILGLGKTKFEVLDGSPNDVADRLESRGFREEAKELRSGNLSGTGKLQQTGVVVTSESQRNQGLIVNRGKGELGGNETDADVKAKMLEKVVDVIRSGAMTESAEGTSKDNDEVVEKTYAPQGGEGSPALPSNPYSPKNVSKRQSELRKELDTGNIDPNSEIPDQSAGRNIKSNHEAKEVDAHGTGERNVGTDEEHSRRSKGGYGMPRR